MHCWKACFIKKPDALLPLIAVAGMTRQVFIYQLLKTEKSEKGEKSEKNEKSEAVQERQTLLKTIELPTATSAAIQCMVTALVSSPRHLAVGMTDGTIYLIETCEFQIIEQFKGKSPLIFRNYFNHWQFL